MTFVIEPYGSADDLPDADAAALARITNAVWGEWIPGNRPWSTEAYKDNERLAHPPEVPVRRLVRDASGAVVALGQVAWRDGTEGGSVARVHVDPDHRRRGIGRALALELASIAADARRTGVTIEGALGTPATGILEAAGLHPDMVVDLNRAEVAAAPRELLERWVAVGEAAVGYSLVGYDAPCPDDGLAAAFTRARLVMNDAPRWEGEPEAEYTVAELRGVERACRAARQDWWTVGVRHDATGEVVGLTELYLPLGRPWIVYQGDTGVHPAHRGHGLGAWMKAVNHLRLRRERPEVELVQTWNASHNEPMLRINRDLGFVPVQRFQGWLHAF